MHVQEDMHVQERPRPSKNGALDMHVLASVWPSGKFEIRIGCIRMWRVLYEMFLRIVIFVKEEKGSCGVL